MKNYFLKINIKNKDNVLYVAKNDENIIIGYAYCKIITENNGPTISHIALLDGFIC